MITDDAYILAEESGIEIDNFKLKTVKALSLCDGYIAIDLSRVENSIEEKELIVHEIGHIETGSFYQIRSRLTARSKCEHKANEYMIKILVPYERYRHAIRRGYTESWDLAEYFDVSDEFMRKVMEYYYGKELAQRNA